MATSTVKTNAPKPSLMPKSFRHVLNGIDYAAEAFEITCKGLRDTTQGVSDVTGLMLSQQKEKLLAELA